MTLSKAFPERPAMTFSRAFIALSAASLCACVPAGKEPPASNSRVSLATAPQTQVARGLAFAEAQCSDCHAVRPGIEPPNPRAPSFVAVANDMGFTRDSLREFFRDGHDLPGMMSIKLDEEDAEIASAYIMSLRAPR